MNYETAAAFRQGLENRLRREIPRHEVPRLRKMIAFERLMARLSHEDWILKGGYALQLRTEHARTTQDVDLLCVQAPPDCIAETLLAQIHQDAGDYFEFYAEQTRQRTDFGSALRFQVTARLAGRVFERFHVDIGAGDPVTGPVEYLRPPPYLEFAGVFAAPIPCYPVDQHIAEKLHALVRPRPVENSRIKDLVDLLIFANLDTGIHAESLREAIRAVFDARGDALPNRLGPIPVGWSGRYNQFTRNMTLPYASYDEAVEGARRFIDPVLDGTGHGLWSPVQWAWGADEGILP